MKNKKVLNVHALEWTGKSVKILDQRVLPEQIVFDEYREAEGVAEAIKTMRVRGAPAIGIAAAYGVALSIIQHTSEAGDDWMAKVTKDIQCLAESRPTAVNLFWALDKMQQTIKSEPDNLVDVIVELAKQIHADDIQANLTMGELGADLLTDADAVMTHCNAGALATGGYGTALGVIRCAYQRKPVHVYAGETRPWLQGARLTVWELAQDDIPSTLIADSAAAWLMKSGKLDWIIVGADRIAANGDVANKIGTYSLAVLASQHGVKVMVVAPMSTIDFNIKSGDDIVIEQRDPDELLADCYIHQESLISAWNPVFDVTPAHLITAIVTEKGVVLNPKEKGMMNLQ